MFFSLAVSLRLPHLTPSADLLRRCYQQCKILPVSLRAWPLSAKVADGVTGAVAYLSNLGDKQTHCISNIRNTLERRSESSDARDTVQPQTV